MLSSRLGLDFITIFIQLFSCFIYNNIGDFYIYLHLLRELGGCFYMNECCGQMSKNIENSNNNYADADEMNLN